MPAVTCKSCLMSLSFC